MKENKNIERLFQEKFKDFEVQPPQDAWDNIEKRLNEKKKKRRVIPFWFKASGIAASLVLGFFLFYLAKDSFSSGIVNDNNPNGEITNEAPDLVNGKPNSGEMKQDKKLNFEEDYQNGKGVLVQPGEIVTSVEEREELNKTQDSYNESQFVGSEEQNKKRSEKGNRLEKKQLSEPLTQKSREALVNNTKSKKNSTNQKESDKNIVKWVESESLTNNTSNSSNKYKEKQRGNLISEDENYQTDLANELKKQQQTAQDFGDAKTNKTDSQKGKIAIEKENNGLIQAAGKANNTVVQNDNTEKGNANEDLLLNQKMDNESLAAGILDFNKNKIEELTEFNNNPGIIDSTLLSNKVLTDLEKQIVQDSTQVAEVLKEENALEKLLKEKEEGKNADEKEKEEKRNKWAVSTNAAPVYFNSLAEGSPLDEQFTSNSKSYQTSLSYGVGVEYQVTPKLALRAGVNSLAFSYDTQNVYHSSVLKLSSTTRLAENTLHVDRTEAAKNIMLYNKKVDVYGDVENFSQDEVGNLNQQIGYVEVPFELSYKLLDKKFGIEVIGGMSTLFLQQNEVKLLSEGMEMNIGKANNLNSIHFSSNVGLGFKYMFLKSFQANLQPMFKYQINTFSENAGNFKPYVIGLYTGISYHF